MTICPSCKQPTQPVGRLSMDKGVVRHCGHPTCQAPLPDEPEPLRARRPADVVARVAALAPRVEPIAEETRRDAAFGESVVALRREPPRPLALPAAPDYVALMRQELADLGDLAAQIDARRSLLRDLIDRLGGSQKPATPEPEPTLTN